MTDLDQYLVDLKCKIIKYGLEYEINNLTDQNNNLKINIAKLRCKNKRIKNQLIEKDNYIKILNISIVIILVQFIEKEIFTAVYMKKVMKKIIKIYVNTYCKIIKNLLMTIVPYVCVV